MESSNMPDSYLPILLQFALALGFVAVNMVVSHLIGPKRHSKNKDGSFECGVESKEDARKPFAIKYFLIAILFVLFDVEVIFFYPWAVNFTELGVQGFVSMIIFVVFILLGFLYIFKNKVLEWER